ncbi:MAG: DNA-formamidopyrimidine glycosylase [Acaryochloridaceae cyanobacterium RU_4_10]|nr:DNA-formamidopyrimidine glycosylase [Acaryochloridaceae cyanobacterium RU_4_10]
MPELPEVETVRLGLNAVTCHLPIVGTEVLLARTITYPKVLAEFQAGLQGVQIAEWRRRGKYLLATLNKDGLQPAGWLGVHLRMSGQLLWVEASEPLHKHTRVRLSFEKNQELRFLDQRTFGQLWWVPPSEDPNYIMSGFGALGPEPLSPELSDEYLEKVLRGRDRPIKNALLDQTLIAGLGNIYVDESLFLSGIHPTQPCKRLTVSQIKKLHGAIEEVIQTALTQGGTTFSSFRQVSGTNGNYGGVAWVYRRGGQPCHQCNTPIEKMRLGGRSCHFCPQCQPVLKDKIETVP